MSKKKVLTDDQGRPISKDGKLAGYGNPPARTGFGEHAMRPALFMEAGEAMFGHFWRSEVARRLGTDKSMLTLLSKGDRTISHRHAQDMHDLVMDRIEVLITLNEEEDWPHHADPESQAAVAKVKEGLAEMRAAAAKRAEEALKDAS